MLLSHLINCIVYIFFMSQNSNHMDKIKHIKILIKSKDKNINSITKVCIFYNFQGKEDNFNLVLSKMHMGIMKSIYFHVKSIQQDNLNCNLMCIEDIDRHSNCILKNLYIQEDMLSKYQIYNRSILSYIQSIF